MSQNRPTNKALECQVTFTLGSMDYILSDYFNSNQIIEKINIYLNKVNINQSINITIIVVALDLASHVCCAKQNKSTQQMFSLLIGYIFKMFAQDRGQ